MTQQAPQQLSGPAPTRRAVTNAAAWAVPVIAAVVTAPQAAASQPGPGTPGLNLSYTATNWLNEPSKYGKYGYAKPNTDLGWIAEGISITLADSNGVPLAGASVTFTLINASSGSFWFTDWLTPAGQKDNGVKSLTLITDANGRIALDNGVDAGYLRYGKGSKENVTLSISGGGFSAGMLITVGSEAKSTHIGLPPRFNAYA